MKQTNAKVAVEVELPRDVLGDVDVSRLSVELRRLWVEYLATHGETVPEP